mmetsp:Transcript_9685/g.26289  ORF Transcript_9685/g.26289 Transcript_9685/m.26289 type:complete len:116 (+) Transcript_9685:97-444(+)
MGGCVEGCFGGGPPAAPGGRCGCRGCSWAGTAHDAARGPACGVEAVTREAPTPKEVLPLPDVGLLTVTLPGGPAVLLAYCGFLQPVVTEPDCAVQAGVGAEGGIASLFASRLGSK